MILYQRSLSSFCLPVSAFGFILLGRKGIEPLIAKAIEFTAQPVNQQTNSSLKQYIYQVNNKLLRVEFEELSLIYFRRTGSCRSVDIDRVWGQC